MIYVYIHDVLCICMYRYNHKNRKRDRHKHQTQISYIIYHHISASNEYTDSMEFSSTFLVDHQGCSEAPPFFPPFVKRLFFPTAMALAFSAWTRHGRSTPLHRTRMARWKFDGWADWGVEKKRTGITWVPSTQTLVCSKNINI